MLGTHVRGGAKALLEEAKARLTAKTATIRLRVPIDESITSKAEALMGWGETPARKLGAPPAGLTQALPFLEVRKQ